MVAERSAKSANSKPANITRETTKARPLRASCAPQPLRCTRTRHSHSSGSPASTTTLTSRRTFIRSLASRRSVCSTLAIMVGSMTTPYAPMKCAPSAAEIRNRPITALILKRQANTQSKAVSSAASMVANPSTNTRPRAESVSGSATSARQSGQLPKVAIHRPDKTARVVGFQPASLARALRVPGELTLVRCSAQAEAHRQVRHLNRSFTRSDQVLEFGEWRSPDFLNDSSSSLISLRWCSVSLMGVSTLTWQYRSPG